ncbi:MAG: DUF3035 domain-containing protein [Pseudomonadota bacterium]
MTRSPRLARRMRLILLSATCAVALGACGQIGNPLEVFAQAPAPDEFMVISRAPLQVPAEVQEKRDASLPRPQPGAPSPLNPDPVSAAESALLGDGTGRNDASVPSTGEAALLAAAAREREPDLDVRAALEADARAAAEAEANAPYQPPTLIELLSGDDSDGDPETLVDPIAESRRLQRTGVPAPSDPASAAPVVEDEAAE